MRRSPTMINHELPVFLNMEDREVLVVGDASSAREWAKQLLSFLPARQISVFESGDELILSQGYNNGIRLLQNVSIEASIRNKKFIVFASNDLQLKEKIITLARQEQVLLCLENDPGNSDFYLSAMVQHGGASEAVATNGNTSLILKQTGSLVKDESSVSEDYRWKKITSRIIIAFALMVTGYLLISALPLPAFREIAINLRPYFDYQFLFFILAGFIAQMIDGLLSMGYGVTSATCLMSFGVNPVSISAAIHTSEIFTSGISGYSHYKFGNVNRKLFRHLVIPGVIGAILGALLLVFLGERAGSWLMPLVAVYAMFLGIKILIKAFQLPAKNRKVKRVGWLAWLGGFLDSFGGGGWGPIVTSSLIAKGRSPKYTIGSVSLTEFFVTLASAATFFVTVGIQHWNIVLGLLIGGSLAAPIAAKLAGKLPRKTMMIAVGIMVIIWCIRMVIKSIS